MVRGVSILSLLVALLVAGWLLTAQQRSGATGHTASQAAAQAQQAASALTFQQAQVQLEQFHALNGTYAGAATAGFDVLLVRADASTYCIQAGTAESASHLAGPGGAPSSGPC